MQVASVRTQNTEHPSNTSRDEEYDGIEMIFVPSRATLLSDELDRDCLYIVMAGEMELISGPSGIGTYIGPTKTIARFQPGDMIDTRDCTLMPFSVKALVCTKLFRIQASYIKGTLVRQLRRRSQVPALMGITSKPSACHPGATNPQVYRLDAVHRENNVGSNIGAREPTSVTRLLRDPLIRLVMESDGVTDTEILNAVKKMDWSTLSKGP